MAQNLFTVGDIVDLGDVKEKPPLGGAEILPPGLVSVGSQARLVVRVSSPARTAITWLPFVPRFTNTVKSAHLNVLSGPFSGCYMIRYQYKGDTYTCHVATPEAKASWNQFAKGPPEISIQRGFRPSDHLRGADTRPVTSQKGLSGDGAWAIFGLITSTNELYTLFGFVQRVNGHALPTVYRIAYISEKIAPLSPIHLRNLT
jgi:hypothetical protein